MTTTKTTKPKAKTKISKQDETSIRLAALQLQNSHNRIDIDAISENVETLAERLNILFWLSTFTAALAVVAFFSVFIVKH
jgi:hypothetical protein